MTQAIRPRNGLARILLCRFGCSGLARMMDSLHLAVTDPRDERVIMHLARRHDTDIASHAGAHR